MVMPNSFREIAKLETEKLRQTLVASGNTGNSTLEAHMNLAEAEMQALSKQQNFLERMVSLSDEERHAAAVQRRQTALNRREMLLNQLQQFRCSEGGSSGIKNGENIDVSTLIPVSDCIRRWAAVYSQLALQRERLSHVLSCSPSMLQDTVVFEICNSWAPFNTAMNHSISILEKVERTGSVMLSTRVLRGQYEQVVKMQLQAISLLNRERHRRHLLCENTADLFKDQQKLLVWCREQQETLEKLEVLTDIREFCASFVSNVAVMDTNFLVLLERSETLMDNSAVREALVEVNRAWMQLAVAAYEKMCRGVREDHVRSGVEVACGWWLNTFEPHLRRVLVEARDISNHPDMSHEPLLVAIRERSGMLLRGLSGPRTIVRHISDFTVRMGCMAPHEKALREVLLARFSLLAQTLIGDAKYPGQREYMDRLCELSEWLDAHAASGAYMQLLQRVDYLRDLAREQLNLLQRETDSASLQLLA
ncbi:uncharacterized protein TM35_000021310 [Trypanosoma theileri]|uniref:Uncharacterized protein n=1 Tax=Trypanosoma theileri TaxID=67003 RepID=A0A1X0P7I7_9TRYP|nr:uncharacterized protein TM35_000021310 [Trypanosoma theileri]ORC92805.1 hypothetical protein TM35_000021310 [Trypanosoma theileri]